MLARAFARQVAGKKCFICQKRVPHDAYQRHIGQCKVSEDDDECQVLLHLTAEDKQRHARENFIDLAADHSSPVIPKLEDICAPSTSRSDENVPVVTQEAAPVPESSKTRKRASQSNRTARGRNAKSQRISVGDENRDVNLNTATQTEDPEVNSSATQAGNPNVVKKGLRRSRRLSKTSAVANVESQVEPEPQPTLPKKERRSVGSRASHSQQSAKRCIFPSGTDVPLLKAELCPTVEQAQSSLEDVHEEIVEALMKKADFYHSPTTSPVKKTAETDAGSVGAPDLTTLPVSPSHAKATPYYLRFTFRILHKVFCLFFREASKAVDFWSDTLRQIATFFQLSEKAQTLFIRLISRQRRWLTVSRLKYSEIATDLLPIFKELADKNFVESVNVESISLVDAINLLQAHDLQGLCKKFKIDYRLGRPDSIKALLKNSKQKNVYGNGVEAAMLKKVIQAMGPTFRVNKEVLTIVTAIFTLYAPVQMDTVACWDDSTLVLRQQLIYNMLLLQTKKTKYPAPLPCSSSAILSVFEGLDSLKEYLKAKESEQDMAMAWGKSEYSTCISISDAAYGELQLRLNVESEVNLISKHSSYPHCLRKYTDTWVLVRIVSHGVDALQRAKNYPRAVEMLEFLLKSESLLPFCPDSRGTWWDRLALNLDAHLKDKRKSLLMCQEGLQDDHVALKEKLLLQDRATKLDKSGEFPLVIQVTEPKKVTITGLVLGKDLGDQRVNHFMLPDENGVHQSRPVEEVALNHYLTTLGYTDGVHAEGSIWHTVFGLMFYDIIFDAGVEVAWLSELQDHPTDLNTRDFYHNRKKAFDDALQALEVSREFSQWLPRMKVVFDERREEVNNEISWGIFPTFEHIQLFLDCCKPAMLAKIFTKFITDNRNNRSGFPDLTVWNTDTKKLAVVEVKGPNDRLSTKQRLWLDFFASNGVEAVVCHVVATTCRNLT